LYFAIGAILIGSVKEGVTWLIISVITLLSFGAAALTDTFPND